MSGIYHGRSMTVLKRDDAGTSISTTCSSTKGYPRRWLLKQINHLRVAGYRRTLAA